MPTQFPAIQSNKRAAATSTRLGPVKRDGHGVTEHREHLELEHDSGLGAEVALNVLNAAIAGSGHFQAVAEAGGLVVDLRYPDGDMFFERDVHAAADDEIEGVVVRRFTQVDTFPVGKTALVDVRVNVVVRSPEHRLRKWLDAFHAESQDRAGGVGEHGPFRGNRAIRLAVAALG